MAKKSDECLRELLSRQLEIDPETGEEEPMPSLPRTATYADKLAFTLLYSAMAGELPAIKEVYDRTEGKSTQRVEHDHTGMIEHRVTKQQRDSAAAAALLLLQQEGSGVLLDAEGFESRVVKEQATIGPADESLSFVNSEAEDF